MKKRRRIQLPRRRDDRGPVELGHRKESQNKASLFTALCIGHVSTAVPLRRQCLVQPWETEPNGGLWHRVKAMFVLLNENTHYEL
jgi:hypothetical protein